MSDISDPHGAGRGDRRQAKRAVDDAYAAGRISAVDRSLRVERIEAASTRGDLAMVIRDLTDRPADPAPQRWIGSEQAAAPQPAAESTPVTPTGPPVAPTAPDQQATPAWPPPGYGGRQVAEPGPRSGNGRTIGCVVAVVVFFLIGPLLLAVIVIGLTLAVGGGDVEFSTELEANGDVETWWDEQVDDLASEAGSTVVSTYVASEGFGDADVVAPQGAEGWTYRNGTWAPTGFDAAGTGGEVDLATIDVDAVQRAVDDAVFETDLLDVTDVTIEVGTSGAEPRLTVRVSDEGETQDRLYDLDGFPLD